MELEVLNQRGTPIDKLAVSDTVFGAAMKGHLFHQVVRMQLANRRRGTASTKTRGEVRGGGRKPWRQKGTGRARQGSTRSPLWRGGGIALGPKPRNYAYGIPKKVRRAALCSALSMKARAGRLKIVDRLEITAPKTKLMVALLRDLSLERRTLLLLSEQNINVQLAARNLADIKVLPIEGLNTYDLLSYEYILCSRTALEKLQERLAP
jgi:large subunit ribosomal protein L4